MEYSPVEPTIEQYRRLGKPLFVTEFCCPSRDVTSEGERADWCSALMTAIDGHVEAAIFFCLSGRISDEGFALLDREGNPTETAGAFYGSIAAFETEALRPSAPTPSAVTRARPLSPFSLEARIGYSGRRAWRAWRGR